MSDNYDGRFPEPPYPTENELHEASQPEKCGKSAAPFIPRWGLSFACALDKGHEGACKQGGNCRKHGHYIGENCPQWPLCVELQPSTTPALTRAKILAESDTLTVSGSQILDHHKGPIVPVEAPAMTAREWMTAHEAEFWEYDSAAGGSIRHLDKMLAAFAAHVTAVLRGENERLRKVIFVAADCTETWGDRAKVAEAALVAAQQELSQCAEHTDLAPHDSCSCRLCKALKELRNLKASFPAKAREAMVEIVRTMKLTDTVEYNCQRGTAIILTAFREKVSE